jgi:hypothetical protein
MEDVEEVRYDCFLPFYLDEGEELSNYDFVENNDYREVYIPRTTIQNYLINEGEKRTSEELLLLAKMCASQYELNINITDEEFNILYDELSRKTYRGISFTVLMKKESELLVKYAFVCSFLINAGLNSKERSKKEILEKKKYEDFINRIKESNANILAMNHEDLLQKWSELAKSIQWDIRGFKTPKEKENYYKIVIIEEEMKNRGIKFKPYTQ